MFGSKIIPIDPTVVAAAEAAAKKSRPRVYRLRSRKECSQKNEGMTKEKEETDHDDAKLTDTFIDKEEEKEKEEEDDDIEFTFFAFGCHGNAAEAQKKDAILMNDIASQERIDAVFFLGDNFYKSGIASADDPMVKTHFYDIYADPALPFLAKLPFFGVVGNHCENARRRYLALRKEEKGVERGLHQVAISYLPDENYPEVASKEALYDSETLIQEDLSIWNMPSLTYSLIKRNTQVFFIDSNTYVKDYLEYLKMGEDTPPGNQARWLAEEMTKAKAAGRKTILALHHPLFTLGKRAYPANSDIDLYLNSEEIEAAKAHFPSLADFALPSYNLLLKEVFKEQQLFFDATLCAHDHAMYYYNNTGKTKENDEEKKEKEEVSKVKPDYPLCQVTSGGGGGALQPRLYFREQMYLGCFLKRHGVTKVTCRKDSIAFTIYTEDRQYRLEFNHTSCKPIRHFPPTIDSEEQGKIKKLRSTIKKALSHYFNFLCPRQENHMGRFYYLNTCHGETGAERAHDIWAYISKADPDNYETMLTTLKEKIDQFPRKTKPKPHSFITLLNTEIANTYGQDATLESLCAEMKLNTFNFLPEVEPQKPVNSM